MMYARVGKTLMAGAAVYYAMAACSGGGDPGPVGLNPAGEGGVSSGSSSSSGVVSNAMADTWSRSGSRLKLRYYESSDGARQFAGFRDTERNEDCSFATATLGGSEVTACLPASVSSLNYYADAACETPIALVAKGAIAPRYVQDAGRLFPVAGPFGGQAYLKAGTCTKVGPTPNFDQFAVGQELKPGVFVAAAIKTE